MWRQHRLLLSFSLAFFILFLIALIRFWSPEEMWRGTPVRKGADLYQHYAAAQLARQNGVAVLYRDSNLLRWMRHGAEPAYPFNYVYSPLVAALAVKCIGSDYLLFYKTWVVISLGLLAGAIFLLQKILPPTRFLPCYVLGFPSAAYALILGQNTPLSLFLLTASAALLPTSPLVAGVVLSCMFYKPQLLPFLAFLAWIMRWWRFLLGIILGSLCWLSLTIAVGGWQNFLAWLQVILDMTGQGGQSQNWTLNITWLGFFKNFGISVPMVLWLPLAAFPLALIGIRLSRLEPSHALFYAAAISLPFLPYALSYELLLTLPAFLLLLSNPKKIIPMLALLWWLLALLAHQPFNHHLAFSAPVLTLLSLYAAFNNGETLNTGRIRVE